MATAEEVAIMMQRIVALEAAMNTLNAKLEKEKENAKKNEEKTLTSRKGSQNIRKYSGKPDHFHSWKYKMEMFLAGEEPKFVRFLKWIEEQVDEIRPEDLNEYDMNDDDTDSNVEWMSRQLYLLLAASLEEDSPQLALV